MWQMATCNSKCFCLVPHCDDRVLPLCEMSCLLVHRSTQLVWIFLCKTTSHLFIMMCAHHHHRHQDYSPWNACHGWWGWGQHQDPLPEKDDVGDFVVCICLDKMRKLMMQSWIMMLMMVLLLKMTWGAEGDEGRHSSGGSVAASPSLKTWSTYLSSSPSWWCCLWLLGPFHTLLV